MPCQIDANLNPIPSPGIPIPGFGLPFSPIQLPYPSADLPLEVIEDILALVNQLGALFPSGLFKPNMDFSMKSILDFIANLLSQIAPFMSFYNFIMAALRLFACIIEVLCAIPDPFAVANKLKVLFTECLPPFFNLFPWLALIAMILALLLLILALIEYIVNKIIEAIESIIKNLELLARGASLQDAQSTLAAAQKIASLLCFIENLMAIFIAIAAIIAVINSLAAIAGFTICAEDDSNGCCPPEICPPFIKNNANGIAVTNGKLIYFKEINTDIDTLLGAGLSSQFNLPPLREEKWQIYNDDALNSQTYPIKDIITPTATGNIFWPDGLNLEADASLKKAPYTVDITINNYNPEVVNPTDLTGARSFVIKDCIVVRKPYVGVRLFNNSFSITQNNSGTLNIEGGKVYEADGTTSYLINNEQATLNTFLFQTAVVGQVPILSDALEFDVQFTWKPNHGALAGYQLITVGCNPVIATEKAVFNSILISEGIDSVLVKIFPLQLPDVNQTVACVSEAIADFKLDASPATASVLQGKIQSCFQTLTNDTTAAVCALVLKGASQFHSTVTLSSDSEFVSRPIIVSVILRDSSGNSLSNSLPPSCDLASKLQGTVTFGKIGAFTYDGVQQFNAEITTEVPGNGILTVTFDGKVLSQIAFGTGNDTSSIAPVNPSFIFLPLAEKEPQVRRDTTDISSI